MAELGNVFISSNDPKVDRVNVEIEMLDYDYVKSCTSIHELRAILKKLVSGDYGRYHDLETTVEEKILSLTSPSERKKIMSMRSQPTQDDIDRETASLADWSFDMTEEQRQQHRLGDLVQSDWWNTASGEDVFSSFDDDHDMVKSVRKRCPAKDLYNNLRLPPVRGREMELRSNEQLTGLKDEHNNKKKEKTKEYSPSRPLRTLGSCGKPPSSKLARKETMSNLEYYRAWDKYDVKAAEDEIDALDEEQEKRIFASKTSLKEKNKRATERREKEIQALRKRIDSYGVLTEREKRFVAERERHKGNECFRCGEDEDAVAHYTKSIALDGTDAVVYSNRAMASIRLGNLERAMADCTTALRLDPAYVKALARRGMIHHKHGRFDEARRDFDKCVRQDPDKKEYALLLRRTEEKLREAKGEDRHQRTKRRIMIEEDIGDEANNEDDAERDISKADDEVNEKDEDIEEEVITPGARDLMNRQKGASKTVGRLETQIDSTLCRAEAFVKVKIFEHSDSEGESDFFTTGCEEEVKKKKEEEASMQSDRLKREGNAAMKLGNFQKAINMYTGAIDIDSRNAAAFNNRALAYLKAKEWEKAEQDASQCIIIDPRNTKAIYRRGVARSMSGGGGVDLEQARDDFQLVLDIDPGNKAAIDQLNRCEKLINIKSGPDIEGNIEGVVKTKGEVAVRSEHTNRSFERAEQFQCSDHDVSGKAPVGEQKNIPQCSNDVRDERFDRQNINLKSERKYVNTHIPKTTTDMENTIMWLSNDESGEAVMRYLGSFKRSTFKKVLKETMCTDVLAIMLQALESTFSVDEKRAVHVLDELARFSKPLNLTFMCLNDADRFRLDRILTVLDETKVKKRKSIRKHLSETWLKYLFN